MKKHSVRYHIKRLPYYRRLVQIAWSYHVRKMKTVPYAPYRIWIEPTNRCNLKCVMCPNQQFQPDDLGFMEFRLFKKIVDEISEFVYDINLHHRGEPTLHPELPEMIRYAKARGLSVKLHTNGTLLNRRMAERILNSGLDLISFSFDGFEAEVYEHIRKGAHFQRTLGNIIGFLELRRSAGLTKPKAVMEIMEFDSARTDPEIKTRLMQDLVKKGMDRIILKQPHNWGGNLQLNTGASQAYAPCTFPWHALVVSWDGKVGPCPHDFFGKIVLGDARLQYLRDIFNGLPMQRLRKNMELGFKSIESPCKECDSVRRKQCCGIPMESIKYIKE